MATINETRLLTLYASGEVRRCHAIARMVRPPTIGEHVYGSLIVAMELCLAQDVGETATGRILRSLILHDAPELVTGDIPAPVKRASPEIAKALAVMEEAFYKKLDIYIPGDDPPIYQSICDAADVIDLAFTMVRERELGNHSGAVGQRSTVPECFNNCLDYLKVQDFLLGVPPIIGILKERWLLTGGVFR